MIRIGDCDDAAGRRARARRLVPGLLVLSAVAMACVPPCRAQTTRDVPKARASPSESKTEKAERTVPAPEVVNAEKLPRQSPDPLEGPPFTTVKAWAIADGRTGDVLWGHREKERLEPASTTKIMTALVVARLMAKDPKVGDEMVTFSMKADRTIGSSAEVREGERLPVRELLYGLLLPSGNDAAVAFAEHFGGRFKPSAGAHKPEHPSERFIAEMNRVAVELGLHETHFENPNGLPASEHRSSARDLARLARHALADPTFARVVSTRKHGCALVAAQGKRRNVVWTNTNRLLDIEGYNGVKTGTTQAAGTCLVASGRRGQDHLIVVVLGGSSSPDSRYPDARNLFRWAWQMRSQGAKPPSHSRGNGDRRRNHESHESSRIR
jgi:D-alanyl-D-alanine carboxypeptidase (penicillin-binding protein 5/6)